LLEKARKKPQCVIVHEFRRWQLAQAKTGTTSAIRMAVSTKENSISPQEGLRDWGRITLHLQ
jgi:hypothetical protein